MKLVWVEVVAIITLGRGDQRATSFLSGPAKVADPVEIHSEQWILISDEFTLLPI